MIKSLLKRKAGLFSVVLLLTLLVPVGGIVLADCSSSDGGATVSCDGTDEDEDGDDNDNSITVESGATVSDSGDSGDDAITGGYGNDTIVNNGTVVEDIEGDRGNSDDNGQGNNPNDGNDNITNNGLVTDDIQGEGGNDNITNNGTVGDDVEGGPGDDTLTNNDTINEDLEGGRGNDTIVNNEGAIVGADPDSSNDGNISGGRGEDEIINSGTVARSVTGGRDNDEITNTGEVGRNLTGDNGEDIITNSGEVGRNINGRGGNDEIVNDGTVTRNINGGNGEDTITNTGDVGRDINGGDNDDTIIVNFDSTVGRRINGGDEDTADTLIFRVRSRADRDAVNEIDDPTVTETITFSNGNTFNWRSIEALFAELFGRSDGGDDEEAIEFEPIKLYDDLTYMVIFIADDGLDFYRYDSPENLEGIPLGIVPFPSITEAQAPETVFETTTEDGYTLQVIVPEDGELAFNLFQAAPPAAEGETPSLTQTADPVQLVDAIIEFE